jgi:hypothetical protein
MFFFQLIKSFFNGSSTHYTFHLSLLRSCCLSCICGSWCVLHVLNLWCVCNLVDYSEVAKVFKRTYMGCWISMQVYFLCCSCFQKKKKLVHFKEATVAYSDTLLRCPDTWFSGILCSVFFLKLQSLFFCFLLLSCRRLLLSSICCLSSC